MLSKLSWVYGDVYAASIHPPSSSYLDSQAVCVLSIQFLVSGTFLISWSLLMRKACGSQDHHEILHCFCEQAPVVT